MEQEQTRPTPPRCPTDLVTKGDLYEFDLRLGERFTTLQDSINGVGDRITTHEAMHVQQGREIVLEKEVKLDAKKVGIVAAIAGVFSIIVTVVKAVVWPQ